MSCSLHLVNHLTSQSSLVTFFNFKILVYVYSQANIVDKTLTLALRARREAGAGCRLFTLAKREHSVYLQSIFTGHIGSSGLEPLACHLLLCSSV